MNYLLIIAVVFGVNLLPAFGPPTWLILVYARLQWNLNPVALVIAGGVAAASGRYLLAVGARHFGGHLPKSLRKNLDAAQAAINRRRRGAVISLGLFALSPLPSAQLFVGAGLLDLNLIHLTLAFFAGRIVSYSLYVGATVVTQHTMGDVLRQVWGSPWIIAFQIALVILVVALPFVRWSSSNDNGTDPRSPTASAH